MPIPKAEASGILPPFLKSPVRREGVSPYVATATELVARYATSPHRIRILQGLLAYRSELRRIGVSGGFQWLDGSFVETHREEPSDVDVVTVSSLPTTFSPSDDHLFHAAETKRRYLCDAYFVNLAGGDATATVTDSVYWFNLFSHQRLSRRWKGLVQIELAPPDGDAAASARLDGLKRGAS
jgi:hypothetical protein